MSSDVGRLYDDLTFFMEEIWKAKGLDKLAPFGWIERDILDYVQNGPKRQGVLAPRGFGKTHLVTAGVTCWDLFRDPDSKILIVSKSETEARKTLYMIRDWIETVPFLEHLRPDNRAAGAREARDATMQFDVGPAKVARDPSVCAKGIEGQVTGTRASRVIGDDVETESNARTQESRRILRSKTDEFTAIASYGEQRVNYVGTFHHEESLYIEESKKGVCFRSWPELYPGPEENVFHLAQSVQTRLDSGAGEAGTIVADYRIDPDFVAKRQARGRSWYAMQCMLIADLGDTLRYPLTLRDMIVFKVGRDKSPLSIAWGTTNDRGGSTRIPDISSTGFGDDGFYAPIMYDTTWMPYTGTRMWIDPSGKGADQTGYAVVSHLNGYLWCKGVGGLDGGYEPHVLERLADIAYQHRVTTIDVEDNFGQGMFAQLFEPVLKRRFVDAGKDAATPTGWRCSVNTVRVSGQKEIRIIEALEPVMNQHRLIVDRSVAENETLQYQITRLTRQRDCLEHDDQVESLAMCIRQWQQELNVDPAKSAERSRQKVLDEEFRKHMALAGQSSRPPRWFQHR